MQLLMGYHNYYTDRRLIPEFDENNERFLSPDYAKISSNPIVVSNSDSVTLGTENLVYEKLMEINLASGLWGVGQYEGLVAAGAKIFVNRYASEISDNVSIQSSSYDKEDAISMIQQNIPVILGCDPILGSAYNYHVVVAYGVADYNNVFGYIVNCGWDFDSVYVEEDRYEKNIINITNDIFNTFFNWMF